ncbi:MAG TPA: DinB family protein [Acidimicrobiia bacterium]|nr:DinB family protein [Acidimicrobiia bacterium]
MTYDWHEWHKAYDQAGSPLSRRLAVVQHSITDALDAAPPGPIRVVSMCAGEGRDLLGAMEGHPRLDDVRARLVELDPVLAATAASRAPAGVEVLCADAGALASYSGSVPADLVIVCGVFGNISDDDMMRTIDLLPSLSAPDATVIWTRHRRPPDATPGLRARFAARGFEEIGFHAPEGTLFGIGVHRLVSAPTEFSADGRLFDFVGYRAFDDACPECGFSYSVGRGEIIAWLRSDVDAFSDKFTRIDAAASRTRPAAGVWSPLEYACHVRDVLRVQKERIELAQREVEPAFAPMRREERAVEDRYNDQDPGRVVEELVAAGGALVALLDGLDDAGWERTGIYNYPEPAPRTVEWIAIHTDHELLHHRGDI